MNISIPEFSPTEAFFIIDSYNCTDFKPALYGYALKDGVIITADSNFENGLNPGENGAYVSISDADNVITITQDFIGSYGLYLYQQGEYFALSNSFFYLVEYLRDMRTLTFNENYAQQFIASDIISLTVEETPVQEIKMLWRNTVVKIDKQSRSISISSIDYRENTIELDSEEGLETIDNWYEYWTSYIHTLPEKGNPVVMDLSGGMDSRLNFCLFLGSNINMNDVCVNSIDDTLHTHEQDYIIADAMAKEFGFTLSPVTELFSSPETVDMINIPLMESMCISYYFKGCFHKQFLFQSKRSLTKPALYFGGDGGECLREYWHMPLDSFVKKMSKTAHQFEMDSNGKIHSALKQTIFDSVVSIQKQYALFNREISGEDLTRCLFREAYCRYHFGRIALESYYGGKIKLSPLLDKTIHSLKLYTEDCNDPQLLMAVILDRYEPRLLDFEFDGSRCINERTIDKARSINKKYPFKRGINLKNSTEPNLSFESQQSSQEGSDSTKRAPNPSSSQIINLADNFFYRCFLSNAVRSSADKIYNEKIYNWIKEDILSRDYFPQSYIYAVLPITSIHDFTDPANLVNPANVSNYLDRTHNARIDTQHDISKFDPFLRNFNSARIDLKCDGEGRALTVEASDTSMHISCPAWLETDNGNAGYVISNSTGFFSFKVFFDRKALLSLRLKGRWAQDHDEIMPILIDYLSVKWNGKELLDEIRTAWHDEPFCFDIPVKANETAIIEVHWLPHRPTLPSISI